MAQKSTNCCWKTKLRSNAHRAKAITFLFARAQFIKPRSSFVLPCPRALISREREYPYSYHRYSVLFSDSHSQMMIMIFLALPLALGGGKSGNVCFAQPLEESGRTYAQENAYANIRRARNYSSLNLESKHFFVMDFLRQETKGKKICEKIGGIKKRRLFFSSSQTQTEYSKCVHIRPFLPLRM